MTTPTTSDIRVSGDDAKEFLQGQLSNDFDRLEQDSEMLAAWCTPKGRVIAVFTVIRDSDGYSLAVPTELAENLVKRLTLYRFRSKVEFELSEHARDVDLSACIEAGLPWIGLEQTEKFTPHMLNLDLLDAVSLDKGCYTGQEIVARTHYKGATKRRTLRFESEKPVSVGDKVSDGSRDLGEVLNASGTSMLTVIPVDKSNGELTVNGVPIERRPLPYLPK